MKTIFDKATREELMQRIGTLHENSKRDWGKMNVSQMVTHCIKWEEMAQGKTIYKQSLIGKIFGKMALKDFVKDEKPFKRSVPTAPGFRIKETHGDVEQLKNKWIALMKEYDRIDDINFMHPFFGRMNKEQTGILSYKHTDHHLRQFNA
jgi:hypothetical protein